MFDKEVTSWPGVTVEKNKMGVSYVMTTMEQRLDPSQCSYTGTSYVKQDTTTSGSEGGDDEGYEDVLLGKLLVCSGKTGG
jgi:hypothetical protein